MSDKVPQGQGFDPEQPLPRGKHDWEKLNVEFTIFNLVIRLSNLPRVLLICQPFQMCISRVVVVEWWLSPIVSSFSTLSCHLGFLKLAWWSSSRTSVLETSPELLKLLFRQMDHGTNRWRKVPGLQVVFLLFGFLVRYRRASIRGKTDSCHESKNEYRRALSLPANLHMFMIMR